MRENQAASTSHATKSALEQQAANSAHAAGALLKRPAALNTAGALSGSSQKRGGAQYERRSAGEFEDGQNRADRPDEEIAISGVKGGGAIRILQSEAL